MIASFRELSLSSEPQVSSFSSFLWLEFKCPTLGNLESAHAVYDG